MKTMGLFKKHICLDFIKKIAIVFCCLFFTSCFGGEQGELNKAIRNAADGKHVLALSQFEMIVRKYPESVVATEAALEGYKLAMYQVKNYKKALFFLHHIVLHAPDKKGRVEAQRQIANIYFDNLTNYEKAILEFDKLLQEPNLAYNKAEIKLKIARAYYYLGNFFQSLSEAKELLDLNPDDKTRNELLQLKANIYLALKDYPKASEILNALLEKNPERAIKEGVYINLVLCYEEMGNYDLAIKTLENWAANPWVDKQYVELRMTRLKERQKNQPGSRGRVRK